MNARTLLPLSLLSAIVVLAVSVSAAETPAAAPKSSASPSLPDNEALLEAVLTPLDMDVQQGAAFSISGNYFKADILPLTEEILSHLDGRTRLREAIQKTGRGVDDNPILLLEIKTLVGLGMLVQSPFRGE